MANFFEIPHILSPKYFARQHVIFPRINEDVFDSHIKTQTNDAFLLKGPLYPKIRTH